MHRQNSNSFIFFNLFIYIYICLYIYYLELLHLPSYEVYLTFHFSVMDTLLPLGETDSLELVKTCDEIVRSSARDQSLHADQRKCEHGAGGSLVFEVTDQLYYLGATLLRSSIFSKMKH